MALLYGSIVENGRVVAEKNTSSRPSKQLQALSLAISAQSKDSEGVTFVVDDLSGDFITTADNKVVTVLAEASTPQRLRHRFLNTVVNELSSNKPPGAALDASFESAANDVDSLAMANTELANVRTVMLSNIDQLLDRGERINLLVDRTGEMSINAQQFRRQATSVQRRLRWDNMKLTVIAVTGTVAFGVLVVHLFV